MRVIKELAEQITDEVDGVTEYAKAALTYKVERPQLADVYYRLANTEYNHVTMLHDQVAKIVKETEATNPDVPPAMRQKWDDDHKAIIAKMAEAKTYLGMYK